jgi:hypothetical protein
MIGPLLFFDHFAAEFEVTKPARIRRKGYLPIANPRMPRNGKKARSCRSGLEKPMTLGG